MFRCLAQVRRIVCQYLGSLFHFAKKPLSPYDNMQKNEHNVFLDRGFDLDPYNDLEAQPSRTGSLTDPVLVDIRELLQKKDRLEDEERKMTRRNQLIKREWMLAARVLNRLCFIFFTTVLIAVNVVFVLVFYQYHWRPDPQSGIADRWFFSVPVWCTVLIVHKQRFQQCFLVFNISNNTITNSRMLKVVDFLNLCNTLRQWYYILTSYISYGRRAFSIAGPTVWNSLPDELRDQACGSDS